MSKAGWSYGNAFMKSCYEKLKDENLNHYNIKNGKNLDRLTNDYIFRYYHYKRLHGS